MNATRSTDTFLQRTLVLSCSAAMLGCGGGSASTQGSAASRTITGSSAKIQIFGTQEARVPVDLSTGAVAALVPAGSSYTNVPGTGLADVTFSIPGVPAGSCLVKVQTATGYPMFYQVDGASLDLESSSLGDPTLPAATQGATRLVLDPGTPGPTISTLDLVSVKAGVVQPSMPAGGTIGYPWLGRPLLDSVRDTDLIITGLTSAITPAGDTFSWIGGYSQQFITPFTLQDGLTNTVHANLTIQGTPSLAQATIDRDAFCGAPVTSQIPVSRRLTTSLVAQPLGTSRGPSTQVRLLTHQTSTLAGLLDTGALAYGDPFPAAWTRVLKAEYFTTVNITPPGGSTTYLGIGVVSQWRIAEVPTASALKPIVGPATNGKINGVSFVQPQTGVGLTPLITWEAPLIGVPSRYSVSLLNQRTMATAGYFLTQQTRLQVPPQILVAGESYYVLITATASPNFDMSRIKGSGWPLGYAHYLSELITP